MASDTSQHIDLITELQKHNTFVANKSANKNTKQNTTQSPKKNTTTKTTTSNVTNSTKDTSEDYSDFDEDSYAEEENKRVAAAGIRPKQKGVKY